MDFESDFEVKKRERERRERGNDKCHDQLNVSID